MSRTRTLAFFVAVPLLFAAPAQSDSCRGKKADRVAARNLNEASNLNADARANANAGASKRNEAVGPGEEMSKRTQGKHESAPDSTWGGDHVRINVRDGGADIEYDCAHGTIDEPVAPDSTGRFDLKGTHVRERGGPVRQGEKADARPARYTGRINEGTMTLTVKLDGSSEELGAFTLTRGSMGRLWKCK